jgi:hypothetical protein
MPTTPSATFHTSREWPAPTPSSGRHLVLEVAQPVTSCARHCPIVPNRSAGQEFKITWGVRRIATAEIAVTGLGIVALMPD